MAPSDSRASRVKQGMLTDRIGLQEEIARVKAEHAAASERRRKVSEARDEAEADLEEAFAEAVDHVARARKVDTATASGSAPTR